jgi:hypothetical protein
MTEMSTPPSTDLMTRRLCNVDLHSATQQTLPSFCLIKAEPRRNQTVIDDAP